MVLNQISKPIVLTALLVLSLCSSANAAEDSAVCGTGSEACLASCSRFNAGDARLSACHNFCRTKAKDCIVAAVIACTESCEANEPNDASEPTESTESTEPTEVTEVSDSRDDSPLEAAIPVPVPVREPALKVASIATKKAMLRELEKNAEMIAAIRAGNLTTIRRLVEVQGLNPTYVYGYEYNPQTRQFDGQAIRLRLLDVFSDTNTLRNDALGLDRILTLFLELGMDVKATLVTPVPASNSKNGDANAVAQVARTAWGPSLKMMEPARDRDARFRAFEIALQQGLVPNDDFRQWLFAELPQVCGRDRSKFAIQVFDLLIQYLGPSVQDALWRDGEQGPETLSDVLDLSFAPPQPKTPLQKLQFAEQDVIWEQCALLSRRINRFLTQGN